MCTRILAATIAVAIIPRLAAAQDSAAVRAAAAPVANPVSAAFKADAQNAGKNLMAAADDMPADRYGFKPTAAQMSFADIVAHLAQGNDLLCGKIGGVTAPTRTKLPARATKDALVARLKETFAFCDQALANLDDSRLAEQFPVFGPKLRTRAETMFITTADWADHYSQVAIYMRLNGLLPPTAKKPM
ncbi:MAG TPA: DinB family protein [Gemmatimonadaceae bacterium]|nr:DinB family protein [Gemmatimonadaceae bacterium]